jgi:hypothetical protein
MHPRFNRKLAVGAAVLAAAAFGGGAYAATQNSPSSARQAFLNDVAKRLNVAPAQLRSAIRSAYFDELSSAVAQHRLTPAQASAIKRRVRQQGALPLGGLLAPLPLAPPPGAGRPFARPPLPFAGRLRFVRPPRPFAGRFRFARPMLVFGGLAAAARYLGLAPMELFGELASGKSLAQIASARGKSVSGLEDTIIASERSMLGKLVASRIITNAREQRLLVRLSKKLDALVNRRGFRMGFVPRALPRRFAPLPPGKAPAGPPIPFGP